MMIKQAALFVYSQKLNQIFTFMILLFTCVAAIDAKQDPVVMLLPIFLSAALLEQSAGVVKQNEYLRIIPRLAFWATCVGVLQFLLVAAFTAFFSVEFSAVITVALCYWLGLSLVKLKLKIALHQYVDMLKGAAFLFFILGPDVYSYFYGMNEYGATPMIVAALALSASVFMPQLWSRGLNAHWDRDAFKQEQRNGTLVSSFVSSVAMPPSRSAHSAANYIPLFTMLAFVIGMGVLGSFFMFFNRNQPSVNVPIMALTGVYVFSLFTGAMFGDQRQKKAWYMLRPGLGNYQSAIKKLFVSLVIYVAAICLGLFLLSLLWQGIAADVPTVDYALNAGLLVFCHVLLSVAVIIWFSSITIRGVLSISLLVLVGLGSWLSLLIAVLHFHDTHQVSVGLLVYAIAFFIFAMLHSYHRYCRLNWL